MEIKDNNSQFNFKEEELKHLCFHCFEVLVDKLNKKSDPVPFPEKFSDVN